MSVPLFSDLADRVLHKLDVSIRRRSCLGEWPWLRKALLHPYRRVINLHGRGVLMNIGGCIPARMPPDYAWKEVEKHEPESMSALREWMRTAQKPLLVDVGCSVGIVSCAGLFCNPSSRVIAIDSDLQSLKSTQRMCGCAPQMQDRLSLVWGYVSNQPTHALDFREAHRAALQAIGQPGISGEPGAAQYICLDSAASHAAIPRHSLGNLIPSQAATENEILVKCDVEGAELLVLKGAETLLAERALALLLSVHPPLLPKYGATKEDVHSLLLRHKYEIRVIAVDHEEHWWCARAKD